MITKLTRDRDFLITENIKLVYYVIKKIGAKQSSIEYEELLSIGTIGLVKAASTFDFSRELKFSTYAYRCISNEIIRHLRKNNRRPNYLSLQDFSIDKNGEKTKPLEEIIEDPGQEPIEIILKYSDIIELLNTIFNDLHGKMRIILLYKLANTPTSEIAKRLKINYRYAQVLTSRAYKIVRTKIRESQKENPMFVIDRQSDRLIVHYNNNNSVTINKVLKAASNAIRSIGKPFHYDVKHNKKGVTFYTTASSSSYYVIAEVFRKLDK